MLTGHRSGNFSLLGRC